MVAKLRDFQRRHQAMLDQACRWASTQAWAMISQDSDAQAEKRWRVAVVTAQGRTVVGCGAHVGEALIHAWEAGLAAAKATGGDA